MKRNQALVTLFCEGYFFLHEHNNNDYKMKGGCSIFVQSQKLSGKMSFGDFKGETRTKSV